MEKFTDSFNKLQSVISIVGQDIDFPQIVVVGSQSDGKSSVLESIVRNGFLPRGTGVVTRTPIILQLRNNRSDQHGEEGTAPEESAEVSYAMPTKEDPNAKVIKRVDNFANVSDEIKKATEALAGGQKNIVNKPITVTMSSPKVPDLTLVDLPGLVEIQAGDQPKDIKQQVEELVYQYIEQKNAIILAIHQATTDLATSKSLNMARKVDPEGVRTLCVVTKVDLVEQGVDLTNLLNGKDIQAHNLKVLKVIGVMNRSKADAEDPKYTAEDQQRKEENYFKTKYKKIAKEHGTRVLSDHLSLLFREHIRKCIPALKSAVDDMCAQHQEELSNLGKSLPGGEIDLKGDPSDPNPQHAMIVKVIETFCNYLIGSITGDVDQGSREVRGGARIERLFNDIYWNALDQIIPMDNVSLSDAWTQIRNSWGVERQMILSIKAFGILVRKEMERMKNESMHCVKMAHQEMLIISGSAGDKIKNVKQRYPLLAEEINEIVGAFLGLKLVKTKEMVEHAVLMQLDYLNIKHPDFLKAQADAMKKFNEIAAIISTEEKLIQQNKPNPTPAQKQPLSKADPKRNSGKPGAHSDTETDPESDDDNASKANAKKGPAINGDQAQKPQPYTASEKQMPRKEQLECEITMELVRQYFGFIRTIVRDTVPKVIMRFMVNEIKVNVRQELLTKLAQKDNYLPLLKESEIMATKRNDLETKLDNFKEAARLVRELSAS